MRSILAGTSVVLVMGGSAALLGPKEPAPPLPAALAGNGDWLVRAVQLSQQRLPLLIAGLVLPPIALWIFVRRGRTARLRRRLIERGIRNQWLLAGIFTLLLDGGLLLLALPLDAASYFLRRAFGLSAETATTWLVRQLAEASVSAVVLVLAVEGFYWLVQRFPRLWWVYANAGYALFLLASVYLQPPDELLSILGHEMGHWYGQHIWKGLLLSWIAAPFGLYAAYRILLWTLPR